MIYAMVAILFSVSLSPIANATDPTEQLSELSHTQWTSREHAPAEVTALAQTSDGFLWLASTDGLIRFDGTHFRRFELPDGSQPLNASVSAVFSPSGNDLWVGLRFGGAYFIQGHQIQHYGEEQGLPAHSVTRFAQQSDGTVWAQTTVGLYRLKDDKWIFVDLGTPQRGVGWPLFVDKHDTLWTLSQGGIYSLAKGATAFSRSPVPGGTGMIGEGPDGEAWVSNDQTGLRSLANPNLAISGLDLGGADAGIGSFLVDRDHVLWAELQAGHQDKLVRLSDPETAINHAPPTDSLQFLKLNEPLASGLAHHVFEDAEGNIWVASAAGLDCFRSNKLHSAIESAVLDEPAIAADNGGAVWLSSPGALIQFKPKQTIPSFFSRERMPDFPSALFVDDDGSAWVGTEGPHLTHFFENRYHEVAVPKEGIAVHAITRDGSGALWIAITANGLYRQSGNNWVKNGGLPDLPGDLPTYLFTDDRARLWLAYPNNRIAMIDKTSHVHVFNANTGLAVGVVLDIAVRGEQVWVSGTEGVSFLKDGKFVSLKTADPTPFIGISGVVFGADGSLWMNGGSSIMRVPATEITAFLTDNDHHVHTESFDYDDGLRGSAVQLRPLPTAIAAADGRLWFTTTTGAYWIDPSHIRTNARPPPVTIEAVTVDGKRILATGGSIQLPAHTTRLQVDYMAASYASPSRVRFRYRLSGVDKDWQEAGNRREAFYTNLTPGLHEFRVIAANEDGVWNDVGATFGVAIPRAFYQTWWFYSLCVLAGAAALWQIYRLRLRQMRLRLNEVLKERERIARELHDTLLQSAQGLILIVQGCAGQLEKGSAMRTTMERALDQADTLLNEARSRVGDLRGSGIDGSLVQAIDRLGHEICDVSGLRFVMESTGSAVTLIQESADQVYRIVREALNNARQHAQASQVTVNIGFAAPELRIRIRDDGKGMDSTIMRKGRLDHYGLQGMKERAERLGAQLHFSSQPNAGTEIELTVPANKIYAAGKRGRMGKLLWAR